MRRSISLTWRRRYLVAGFLAVFGALTFFVAGAFADAGNPILNTMNGKVVSTPQPGYPDAVTVYVRGQWDWQTHNKDCNIDRNGTGVGIIWNDPKSPGFTVTKGTISAGVGVASSSNGLNGIDRMVHPSDVGKDDAGNGLGRFVNGVQQSFTDPAPPQANGGAITSAEVAAWRSGCGAEPFNTDPIGSWGYDKNLPAGGDSRDDGGQGYSHVYQSRADLSTVCVNFYDVHGDSAGFEGPNGTKEITVNGNGDNSIQTNAFNVNQGANCIDFPTIKSTTPVSPVTVGENISDSATVQGASATHQTNLTFHLYGPSDPNCNGPSLLDSGPFAGTGNHTQTSGNNNTGPAAGGLGAGTYQWTVELREGATAAGALLDTSGCGKEPSVVKKSPTKTDTTQALKVTEKIKVTLTAQGNANVQATGDTRIRLFSGPCVTTKEDQGTPAPAGNPVDKTVKLDPGNTFSIDVNIDKPGDFYWFVQYLGDSNTDPSDDDCTETFSVHFPTL
jgi:hypothetical protein